MELGIGLPNAVPGTTGEQLAAWARAAEDAGFSSLGTIDRIVYDNYEPLVALSAAAAVTSRIRLLTSVALGPLRGNPVQLAKQFLSLDAVAGGNRAVLGIGVGGREDDYEVSGIPMSERARRMNETVEKVRAVWDGNGDLEAKIGPRREGSSPSLILGGSVQASFERAARHGDGWMMGGGTPEQFEQGVEQLESAWKEQGRDGEPRKMALGYFSLGPDAEKNAEEELGAYYAWLGDEIAGMIAGSAAKDADTVRGYMQAFESLGCDEFVLFPATADPEQVRLLAEAAGL